MHVARRNKGNKTLTIRKFRTPRVKFDAETYVQVSRAKEKDILGPFNPPKQLHFPVHIMNSSAAKKMEWDPLTVPPLLRGYSVKDLENLVETPLSIKMECHTQSVERGVSFTSDAVKRRRKTSGQQKLALSNAAARQEFSEPVTYKRRKTTT